MKKFNLTTMILTVVTGLLVISSPAFSTDSLYVDSNGNVGIGTSIPQAKLDVASKIRLGLDYYGVGLITADANTSYLSFAGGTSSYDSGSITLYGTGYSTDNRKGSVWIQANSTSSTNGGNIFFYTYDGTNWNERMRINRNGCLGIGVTNPTYQLQLSSGYAYKSSGGTWYYGSDKRIKKDITELTNATELIVKYPKPITYKWINPEKHENQTRDVIGLSAQDLEEVNPDMVVEADDTSKDGELTDGKTKAIFFSNEFFALQLGAVQELIERVEALETENRLIKKEVCGQRGSYSFCK
jgi:hypothetical protein